MFISDNSRGCVGIANEWWYNRRAQIEDHQPAQSQCKLKKEKKKKSLPSHFSSGYSLFFYFFKFFGWFKFWVFKKKLFFIICNLRANGAMKALGLMGFMFDLSTNLIYITLNDIKGKVHVYKHTCTWWSCLLHTSFDNRTLPIFSAETLLFVTKSSLVYKSVFVFFISEVLYIQLMYVFM